MTAADLAEIRAHEAKVAAWRRARPIRVYIGTGHPHHVSTTPAPVFLSATALVRYRARGEDWNLVQSGAGWAGDSGAFTAWVPGPGRDINRNHPWHWHPDEYGALWARLADDIVYPDFIAPQDIPCEPVVRERTGKSARYHADASIESYLYLVEQFPFLPWLPVLQGWDPADYDYAADRFAEHGVDVFDGQLVGLGSICRRGSERDIAALVERFADRGARLHGFGVSIDGLRRIGHLLASTDSQAWSMTARRERIRLDGCTHVTKAGEPSDCRNCFRYALSYREEMLAAIESSRRRPRVVAPQFEQLALFGRELVAA